MSFSDNFEAYTLGSTPGSDASWIGTHWRVLPSPAPVSSGTVIAGNPDGLGSKSFQLGQLVADDGGGGCRFEWQMRLPSGNNISTVGMLQGQLGTGGYNVFQVGMNQDGRLWVSVLGDPSSHQDTYIGSSKTQLTRGRWYSIIACIAFTTYVIGSDTFIAADARLAIDGFEEVATPGFLATGVSSASIGGTASVTRFFMNPGTLGGSFIDNFALSGYAGGAIAPPVATAPAKAYSSIIEIPFRKANKPQAKVYQSFIELIVRKRGWKVYEA